MATVLTIGGTPVTLSDRNSFPVELTLRYRGYSTLTIQRQDGMLLGLPDPWLGKTVSLAIGGTTYFQGDITDVSAAYGYLGWVHTYQCCDLKRRGDQVPLTDANTLTDVASYNLPPDDPQVILSREGRTVGQILTSVLTMVANATALNGFGIGAYTSMGPPPVLPASTVADLAALTIIPPSAVYVQGEKLINAIEAFVRFWCPNYFFLIQPSDGALRFLDQRTFTNHTFTLGTDPIEPSTLSRSVRDCFQRVQVRGQPIAEPKLVETQLGTLAEDFAWGTYTNTQAKNNWTPAQGLQNTTAIVVGTCSCVDTLNITVDPTDPTVFWSSNFWDQSSTGHQGVIMLTYSAGTGINLTVTRRIVSNAALIAGGTGNITVDLPLPATNYDKFSIYGIVNGAGLVWRKYKVVDTAIAAAMANQFTYPTPWVGASGNLAVMVSYPMGSVCWSNSGAVPWNEWPSWFTQDPSIGEIYFQQPTFITCGNHVPSNVRALLAINTGVLTATYPPDTSGPTQHFGGTSNTVEGLTGTLTVTVGQWRDPINQAAMNAYAHDLFDSVSDSIVEGQVVYHGYYGPALTPGLALSVTGSTYTTGWEGLALPIQEVSLRWNSGSLTQFTTVMSVSNRRAHFTSAQFLRPDRWIGGQQIGQHGGFGYAAAIGTRGAMAGLVAFGQDMGSVAGNAGAALGETGAGAAGAFGSITDTLGIGGDGEEAGFDFAAPGENAKKYQGRKQYADRGATPAAQNKVIQEEDRQRRKEEHRERQKQQKYRKADIGAEADIASQLRDLPGKGFVDVPPTAEKPEMPRDPFTPEGE